MKNATAVCVRVICALLVLSLVSLEARAAEKMPPAKAGTISQATGQIAFIRDKNIWLMNADGSRQTPIAEVLNADGRLSFAPDNRRILFSRSGTVDFRAPDNMGGRHKVYDLFIAYVDSAQSGNTLWWRRITDDLGSRNGEWLPNGEIIFAKDLNANMVNAVSPNYQLCITDAEANSIQILRKDWLNANEYMLNPTMNANGDIAFVHFYDQKPQGLAMLNRNSFMVPWDSVRVQTNKNKQMVAPAFSPDGKWLAYVGGGMENSGIFIATPDLKEKYVVWEPPVNVYPNTVAPSFSPDSKWLTWSTTDGSIWISDITGNQARRLTGPGNDKSPAWSKAIKK